VRRSGASFSGEFSLDNTAMLMAGDVEVMVPLDGLVDAEAERDKLDKELGKVKKDRDYLAQKLSNAKFVERAPLEVLDKDRARLSELNAAVDRLEAALMRFGPNKKKS
ncbi:MAG TPA: hypothetical protein VG319_08205, partial [Polyangia bacterium]|nr:hypothetical protein [Polyangia bacterium]